jgi:SAM-dependent methyltransferase
MTVERANEAAATEDFEFMALAEARHYRAALLEEFRPWLRGRVLEVGAGVGQFTESLARIPEVHRLVSVEPDPDFCRRFRAALPQCELIEGTSAQIPPGQAWDALLSVNVLEHIREDETELAHCRDLLGPARGHVCLFVPARPEIYAPIDGDFGHHRRYRLRELRRKLESAGFEVVRLHYFNLVGYFAWWFNFCVRKQRSFAPKAVRFFDRVIFPPTQWLERRVGRPPFGQSLMAVARARGAEERGGTS